MKVVSRRLFVYVSRETARTGGLSCRSPGLRPGHTRDQQSARLLYRDAASENMDLVVAGRLLQCRHRRVGINPTIFSWKS